MLKTPEAGITWKNQSMLMAADQGVSLRPNVLLTQSDPTSFLFASQYSTYRKNGVVGYLPAQDWHKNLICLQH